jgi:hypothetical protein
VNTLRLVLDIVLMILFSFVFIVGFALFALGLVYSIAWILHWIGAYVPAMPS